VLPKSVQLVKLAKGRVLDVGCPGHFVEPESPHWQHGQLVRHFPEVMGIDLSSENVEKLRSYGYSSVSVANAETFSRGALFDTIVAGDVIEHLTNPGFFLLQARNHLGRGGRLVLSTPSPFSVLCFLYGHFTYPKTCQNREHTYWFCIATITELRNRLEFLLSHYDVIEDYRLDEASLRYRSLVRLVGLLGWVIPKRLRCNTMVFVLEPRV
jgi:2-polyprenyl-3-methyl-5-hydroxy-6-metoxy-1,4-benzoquinol methylase